MENIKHKFSFSDQNLGKETDVSANSGRVKFKNSLSTLHQIKGESRIIKCALFLSVKHASPTSLDTKQVLQNEFSLVDYSSTL